MPCTEYVSERSLLIDGLTAGAKACLCGGLFAAMACASSGPATTQPAGGPVAVIPSVLPVRTPAPIAPPDLSCDPFPTTAFTGAKSVVATVAIEPADIRQGRTAAHRFVFDRAYETLVRVDCAGRVIPGLAARWTSERALQSFVIRSNARFWNGDAVTAKDVVASWRASGDSIAMLLADSSLIANDSTLSVAFEGLDARVLASPLTIVTRTRPNAAWPEGTGTHRIVQSDRLTLEPARGESAPTFHVRGVSLAAARNLIDDGIDVLITGDSATAAYAARRLGASPVSLDWDRTWMLVVPDSPSEPMHVEDGVPRVMALRDDLARDAVRANARRATAPAWLSEPSVCPSGPRRAPTRERIAYQGGDLIARAIAERIVALASPRGADTSGFAHIDVKLAAVGSRLTTVPLSTDALMATLRAASEVAFVVSVPYHAARACTGAHVIPLLDTRWQAVIRP